MLRDLESHEETIWLSHGAAADYETAQLQPRLGLLQAVLYLLALVLSHWCHSL